MSGDTTLSLALGEADVQRIADAVTAKLLAAQVAVAARQPGRSRLTVREAAEELRCSERKVRRLIAMGRLSATKLGSGGSSRPMIARADVERLREEGV